MEVVRRRKVRVSENQFVGRGIYQEAYKIAYDTIVKIPMPAYNRTREKEYEILQDEIKGSKQLKLALPILEIVDVELPNGDIRTGTVRQYIPHRITYTELRLLIQNNKIDGWDLHTGNVRKDDDGNYWRTDTQFGDSP